MQYFLDCIYLVAGLIPQFASLCLVELLRSNAKILTFFSSHLKTSVQF